MNGPNEISRFHSTPRCWTTGVARTVAPLFCSAPNRSSFANVGRSVVNFVYVESVLPGIGAAAFSRPSMVSPRENTSATFCFCTCAVKSVYATVCSPPDIWSCIVVIRNSTRYPPTIQAAHRHHRGRRGLSPLP